MGRSPGKWFRSLLSGKKSPKSGTSKKSSNEKASVISTNAALSGSSVHLPLVSEPVASSAGGIKEDSNVGKGMVTDEVILPAAKQDEEEQISQFTLVEDTEKMRLEEAATKTQAIFRGYLARRAFLRLKGIISLQAFVRGHLVRRQAVATLYCIHGIVKLQARVRGQIARRSSIGCEVITKGGLGQQDAKQLDLQRNNASKIGFKLSKNEFTTMLLASSPTVMPLHLYYGPEEPNSSQEWLARWTRSHIWRPRSKAKTLSKTKHQKVGGMAMSKNNGRKVHSKKMQNGSNNSSSGSEKKKSSHSVNSVPQNPVSEIKKVKQNLKKVSSPLVEKAVHSEVDTERKSQNHDKASNILVPEGNLTSDEPLISSEGTIENSNNVEAPLEMPPVDDTITRLDSLSVSDAHQKTTTDTADCFSLSDMHQKSTTVNGEDTSVANEGVCTNHDKEGSESNKTNRRISLPAKHDVDTGGQTTRKVPSYMAPTKSAKAKLKDQASPRFGQDVAEKNGLTRRHSLPISPMNGKLSSSPRVQRLVQASGKEGFKIDRSLSSSRDGTDKTARAEWKR